MAPSWITWWGCRWVRNISDIVTVSDVEAFEEMRVLRWSWLGRTSDWMMSLRWRKRFLIRSGLWRTSVAVSRSHLGWMVVSVNSCRIVDRNRLTVSSTSGRPNSDKGVHRRFSAVFSLLLAVCFQFWHGIVCEFCWCFLQRKNVNCGRFTKVVLLIHCFPEIWWEFKITLYFGWIIQWSVWCIVPYNLKSHSCVIVGKKRWEWCCLRASNPTVSHFKFIALGLSQRPTIGPINSRGNSPAGHLAHARFDSTVFASPSFPIYFGVNFFSQKNEKCARKLTVTRKTQRLEANSTRSLESKFCRFARTTKFSPNFVNPTVVSKYYNEHRASHRICTTLKSLHLSEHASP